MSLLPFCGGRVADDANNGTNGYSGTGGTTVTIGSTAAGGATVVDIGETSSTGGCLGARVTFQVRPPDNAATHWCISETVSDLWWADVSTNSAGSLMLRDFCTPTCDCGLPYCMGMTSQLPTDLGDGLIEVWDATYVIYSTTNACDGTTVRCAKTICAEPGQYTLTVCGYQEPNSNLTKSCQRTSMPAARACFSTPFQYPASAPVIVTFPNG